MFSSRLDCSKHFNMGVSGFVIDSSFFKNPDNYMTFFIGHVMKFHLGVEFDEEFAAEYKRATEEEIRLRLDA